MRSEPQSAPADRLIELLSDPSAVTRVPAEAIPALRGELARLDSLLLARLLFNGNGHREPQDDRLLDAAEASQKLGTTEDWIYRHASKLPFAVRLGTKQLRFSRRGIERYIQQRSGP